MKLLVTFKGDKELVAKMERLPDGIRAAVRAELQKAALRLVGHVKQDKLSDQVLRVRTGRLRRSINMRMEDDGKRIDAYVGTNVNYGRFWELGFSKRVGAGARGGPKGLNEKALARYIQQHPPGVREYGARSFLRSALADMKQDILNGMAAAVRGALK